MLEAALFYTTTLVVTVLVSIGLYFYWLGFYWKLKGVPSYGNSIVGIFKDTFRLDKSIAFCLKRNYEQRNNEKYYGTFLCGQPVLVIHDLEIIKEILVKESPSFSSHGRYYDMKNDPLSGNLFFLAGSDWKFMRTKLTPTFTSGKIKFMFKTIQDCIASLPSAVEKERTSQNGKVDVRELLARLGTNIISSVAFGIEANSLEETNSEFRKIGKMHTRPTLSKLIRFVLMSNYKFAKLTRPKATLQAVSRFLTDVVNDTVDHREKNNVTRNDFMDLMIRLKKEDENKPIKELNGRKITIDDIAAQTYIFFIAGFETSSSTAAFALLELAKNPEIQRKVQEECDRVMQQCEGNVTYEAVQSMEYVDRVLQETMRYYPSIPFLPRATTKACKLPLTNVDLDKDTLVYIPLLGMHYDEKYFPDPLKFDPDRFAEENKKNIQPYSYMPFGDGPRQCIGMRFAMVQMKSVLLQLMSKYSVDLSDEINPNVEYEPYTFFIVPKGKFTLKLTSRCTQ